MVNLDDPVCAVCLCPFRQATVVQNFRTSTFFKFSSKNETLNQEVGVFVCVCVGGGHNCRLFLYKV